MMTYCGRSASIATAKTAQSPERVPSLMPARLPAALTSWQGNPPHNTSTGSTLAQSISVMLPKFGTPGNLCASTFDAALSISECQTVCPPNRREEQQVGLRAATGPAEGAWVPLLALLAADDDAVLQRWGRWYLHDRRTVAVRRNALLALGNAASPSDERVVRCLQDHLHHDDPVLRATAVWSARRLGLDHLAILAAQDPDAEVRAELEGPVPRR